MTVKTGNSVRRAKMLLNVLRSAGFSSTVLLHFRCLSFTTTDLEMTHQMFRRRIVSCSLNLIQIKAGPNHENHSGASKIVVECTPVRWIQPGSSTLPLSLIRNNHIDRFHMTSWRPFWCTKTMKRRPFWCTKPILWELNSFLM